MLVDDIKIIVAAGSGGNGSVHFKRNAQTTKGGPDGGNGGNGGNIYFQGIDDVLGLAQFQYKKEIKADNGVNGGRNNLYGKNAGETIVKIPLGTMITDLKTGEQWEITNQTDKILMAQGGKGGRGNKEFATAIDQAPYYAEPGNPGQTRNLHLVLRIIADIGFIGLPNAGKSSLLSVLTNAKPKIANYPFTTLEPNLGVVSVENRRIILADIPGLIEGASKGKGLGIKFLRHIEKTKILFHCIDISEENILSTYKTVRKELEEYSSKLAGKKEIILLTKTDLVDKMALDKKLKEIEKVGKEVFTVSIYAPDSVSKLQNFITSSVKL